MITKARGAKRTYTNVAHPNLSAPPLIALTNFKEMRRAPFPNLLDSGEVSVVRLLIPTIYFDVRLVIDCLIIAAAVAIVGLSPPTRQRLAFLRSERDLRSEI